MVQLRGRLLRLAATFGTAFLFLTAAAPRAAAQPASSPHAGPAGPEVRALWVDSFHAGIRTPEEAAQLVADATRIYANTLFVQVRRRGDALYTGGLEPPLDDPAYDPTYDALARVIEVAHAAGLKVHAWINAMPVWRDDAPPKDPRHVFNLHGPSAAADTCWLTSNRAGVQRFPIGYFLDPGHPAAREHLVAVYLDIVRRYPLDGIHFDYIRYPETDGPSLPRGADVGYNAVSLRRFQAATGRSDVPDPGDEAWIEWRRQQVTQFVRRVSVEARAIKPRIEVSAASIAWGVPPATLAGFEQAAPMQRVFQDWRGWLVEGLLYMSVPMNYAREHYDRVRGWFDGWIAWEKQHKADRKLVVGVGGYLSAPEGVLAQVARVRATAGKARADGVSFFSYFRPSLAVARAGGAPAGAGDAPPADPAVTPPDRLDFLAHGAGASPPAFTAPTPAPLMPWIDRPTHGFLAGTVTDPSGAGVEAVTVRVRRTGWFRRTRLTTTDAIGLFGMTRLKPGRYRVRLQDPRGATVGDPVFVRVTPGGVARAALTAR